jgi:4-alpha-glucanotransferase
LRVQVLQLMVNDVKFPRSGGILLHISSLPGGHGIGDLGASAVEFTEFLAAAGQRIWQVLPVGPTGFGDSPYQSFSAFAGNPLFIDLNELQRAELLRAEDFLAAPKWSADKVDYAEVIPFKMKLLRVAAERFFERRRASESKSFEEFCGQHSEWLSDYALFMAVKEAHQGVSWTSWDPGIRDREPSAVKEWTERAQKEIDGQRFCQFVFFEQWQKLKAHCASLGIRLMGDLPIYVAHDSSDVWAHKELFQLNRDGSPAVVAGVPPDYFSATGQLWGNPIYRWDLLAQSGYAWWVKRFRSALSLFDMVRLDHFRGFEAYWQVPGDAETAAKGRWVKGPGAELFRVVQSKIGDLPIVAENLGVITPEVEAIRHEFNFPGMSLLQFAFGNDPQGPSFRPHNYARELVAYTGGHDNDTTVGWWNSTASTDSIRTAEDIQKERAFARAYLGFEHEPVNWVFIRAVMSSVADTAIIPLQDVLGLGTEARMNLPGTKSGNWRWRYVPNTLTSEHSDRLAKMAKMYDRSGDAVV